MRQEFVKMVLMRLEFVVYFFLIRLLVFEGRLIDIYNFETLLKEYHLVLICWHRCFFQKKHNNNFPFPSPILNFIRFIVIFNVFYLFFFFFISENGNIELYESYGWMDRRTIDRRWWYTWCTEKIIIRKIKKIVLYLLLPRPPLRLYIVIIS